MKRAMAGAKDHQEVVATVSDRNHEREEYRNFKGRQRVRNNYTLSYEFTVEGETYSNTADVGRSEYEAYEVGSEIAVWYATGDPHTHALKSEMESALSSNDTLGNMIQALPFTLPACYFLYLILKLLFVRESKKALPQGFYTDTSWLDCDDRYVVFLTEGMLVYFKYPEKVAGEVQVAYQEAKGIDEIIRVAKAATVERIPLAEISELTSHHNSDVINIEQGDNSYSVEFLNQTVKAHALERIKAQIPTALHYDKRERTRLQAAMPSGVFLAVLAALALWADHFVVYLLLGLVGIVFVLPVVFSRLIDPTITEQWSRPAVETE